jgi:predicted Zn-dependent peptidase
MIKTFHLPNGISGICEERPGTGTVSMHVYIKQGSIHEPADEAGLTFLTQELTNYGTTTRSREQIAEATESKGSSLSTSSDRTLTTFEVDALTRHAAETFVLLADLIRNPAFPPKEIKKVQSMLVQAFKMDEEDITEETEARFHETVFAGQSAATDPRGTADLIQSFTLEQIRKKHAELLAHPENIIFSFGGDITTAKMEELVRTHFGDLPPATTPATTPQITFTPGDVRAERGDASQLNLILSFQAPSYNDRSRYAATLFEQILSGGLSSPLFVEVRGKRGLVYNVNASYAPFETTGLFSITAGTGPGNAGELIPVVLKLLGDFAREGVDSDTLTHAREHIMRGAEAVGESIEASVARNAIQMMHLGRPSSSEEYESRLSQVTSDDIRRFAVDMLQGGRYALAGIGPQDTMPSSAEISRMMQEQVQGITIAPPEAQLPSLRTAFTRAAQKEQTFEVEPQMTTLKNGLRVVTCERPGLLVTGAWIGAGSDNGLIGGEAHALEHMSFFTRGPGNIARIVENDLGGELNAFTGNDTTAYHFSGLRSEALGTVVEIEGEMVFHAKYHEKDFNGAAPSLENPVGNKGERGVVIEEINRAGGNLGDLLNNLMMATAYPDQSHGAPILGTEATVRTITVQDLTDYRNAFYTPGNTVFSVAGPIKHADFVEIVERNFGNLPSREIAPMPLPVYHGGTAHVEATAAALCSFVIAAEAVPVTHPDYLIYEVFASILGDGETSRLSTTILNKLELAADISSGINNDRNAGMFLVSATAKAQDIKPLTHAIYKAIRKLATTVTQGELDKFKACIEMGTFSGTSNATLCEGYASDVLEYGRPITPKEVMAEIENITLADIKRIAEKVLTSNPTMAMLVPEGTKPAYLPSHDEVLAMRDGKATHNYVHNRHFGHFHRLRK